MGNAFTLTIDQEGLGSLVFDQPGEKVNKFSPDAVGELDKVLNDIAQSSEIKALVISSAKPGIFIAGADISVIQTINSQADALDKSRVGHSVFDKLAALPFPTIALIDGACLGGGLEMALACDFRVVTDNPKTQLGLPEVNLGIIPGWGGTQRLPNLIGLTRSLPMILGGKAVDAKKAWRSHLADALVASEFQEEQTKAFVKEALTVQGRKKIEDKRKACSWMNCLLERNPVGRKLIFNKARQDLLSKTGGHYPAPQAALDVIETSHGAATARGFKEEQSHFAELAQSATSKNLIQVFFTSEALKKEASDARKASSGLIKSVGVLGGGVMGGGIAWLVSKGEIPVRIKDVNWNGVAKGFEQASKVYHTLTKIRKCTRNEAKVKMHHITGTLDYMGFKKHDLIIEAVVENLDIKKTVLSELEAQVRDDTIICSNTSTFSITEMASILKHPERFVGMHFFNPVNRMPLVEIVPGKDTSAETVNAAVAFIQGLGKTPIVVQDCPGFLVNRILFPYLNEALHVLDEGIDFEYVDKCITDFGMPMGPFTLDDEVGLDTAYKAAKSVEDAYGGRMRTKPHIGKIVEAGLLGKKNGKGFYIHEKGKKRKRNPDIESIIGLGTKATIKPDPQLIVDRIILPMVNEAARCLEDKIVEKPEYLDMAMILGVGFPPFRGGPLRYADSRGLKDVVERLDQLAKQYDDRFRPTELLRTLAGSGKTFYNQ